MIKKISVCIIFFLMTFYVMALFLHPSQSELPGEKPHLQAAKEKKIPESKKEPEKKNQKKEPSKDKMIKVKRMILPPELLAALSSPPPESTRRSAPKQDAPQTHDIKQKSASKDNNAPVKTPKPDMKKAAATTKVSPAANLQKHNKKTTPKKLPQKVVRINGNDSKTGAQMKKDGQQLPLIEASWDNIGFDNYLQQMLQAGGRLYVGNVMTQKIISEIDIHYYRGSYRFLRFINSFGSMMDNMALFRPREIANETLVDEILSEADNEWANGDNFVVVMLLPADIEYGFLGSLKNYLSHNGYAIDMFTKVNGQYFISGNELGLKLESAVEENTGRTIELGLKLMI